MTTSHQSAKQSGRKEPKEREKPWPAAFHVCAARQHALRNAISSDLRHEWTSTLLLLLKCVPGRPIIHPPFPAAAVPDPAGRFHRSAATCDVNDLRRVSFIAGPPSEGLHHKTTDGRTDLVAGPAAQGPLGPGRGPSNARWMRMRGMLMRFLVRPAAEGRKLLSGLLTSGAGP